MDGRRFRRWWLCGGLLAAGAGCDRNTYPNQFSMPKSGQPVAAGATPTTTGFFAKKPVWGGGGATPADGTTTPGVMPAEGATTAAKPRKPGQGFQPETLVTFGDTWAESAFMEPPPPNRDELLDRARQAYDQALQKDPKYKGALLGAARLHARLNDRDRATAGYKRYFDLYPKDAETMHEVAVAHARWKDWAGATAWCETALRVDPENRAYRKTMGFCLARGGKWDDGFATLCRIMPEAQARYNMARVMEHQNQSDASRQQLQLAIQADANYAPAREFLAELDQTAPPAGGVPAQAPNPIQQVSGTAP